jgi:hypothetical protein
VVGDCGGKTRELADPVSSAVRRVPALSKVPRFDLRSNGRRFLALIHKL